MKLNYLLLIFGMCFMQTAISQTSLEVTFKRCNNNKGFSNWSYFKIFNESDTIKLSGLNYDSTFTLNVLSQGPYKYTYKTVLNSTITKKLEILENQNNILEVCVDKLESYERKDTLIIDLLQNSVSYNIHFFSEGCFHRESNAIEINKTNSGYYILYNEHKRLLTKLQIDLLREFEIEVKNLRNLYCTTTDYYTLKYSNNDYKYIDSTCEWSGFYYLLRNLEVEE